MAQVVLSDISDDAGVEPETLFQGLKFFISHKVPQRSRFINDVRFNGGEVLPIEKHADVKIVDHARKEALPGTYSYRYIENSVRNGVLEDLKDHRVGPAEGTVRNIGSTIQPPKGTRSKYTQDDDRILWNWVHEMPQKGGGTDGNEIYKQLEAKHPQHPWQSWRDRWIKQLKGKPRPFPLPHNAPPTPPSDVSIARHAPGAAKQSEQPQKPAPRLEPLVERAATASLERDVAASPQPKPKASASRAIADDEDTFGSFDENDAEALMVNGESILEVPPENVANAWESWARDCPTEQGIHTARDWQTFWEDHVRRRYLKRKAKKIAKVTGEPSTAARLQMPTPSRKSKLASQPLSSPITEKGSNASIGQKSPSYHPESPSMQLLSQSPHKERRIGIVKSGDAGIPHNPQENISLAVRTTSAIDENLKRKQVLVEDEVPSSSPPGIAPSPKRRRTNASEPIREIASTPDMTPVHSGKRPDSPLFIGSEKDGEDKSDLEYEVNVYESPLGKQASDTLSEPGRMTNNTQVVFRNVTQQVGFDVPLPEDDWDTFLREPTQQVDFEIPPPDNGWGDEDSGAEASSESEPTATDVYDPRPVRQGTQAILRGKTPALDFDVPDPEGGWDLVITSSTPPLPSSPHAESEVSDVDAQTEAWINSYVAGGISVDHVVAVLKATSMDTGLAEEVLKIVGKNGQMPKDKRGVWTETDDEDLGATDARKIQKLELKHGKDYLTARWEFLDFYKSA